jgi:tetratricopeptide (TPR) repeat protein
MINEDLKLIDITQQIFDLNRQKLGVVYHQNAMVRASVIGALCKMGMLAQNISIVSEDFGELEKVIREKKPEVIVSQDYLENKDFRQILEKHEKLLPERLKTIFVVLTEDNSPAAASIVLEHFIDIFLAIPFTAQGLNNSLVEQFENKFRPALNLIKFEEGRSEFFKNDFEKAQKIFNEVDDPLYKPLALSLLGIIASKSNQKDLALSYFHQGLKASPKNYISFKGALDLLIDKKDFVSAYDLNQQILQIFPFNPEQIPTLITLAIATKKYNEILELNNLFKELKHVSPKNKKYLAAGLMMGAQFLITQNKLNESKQSIQTAVALSPKSRTILIKACILLAEQKFKNESLAILSAFYGDDI